MKPLRSRLAAGVAVLAIGGVGFGLMGSGIRAAFTDAASATQNIKVGTLGCVLRSTGPVAVISNGGATVTVNMPDIVSSSAGSDYSNFTVTNNGTMPTIVHWTTATSGTIAWQPAVRMGYASGSVGNLLSVDLTLAPGDTHSYVNNVGFQWAALTNADLGRSATVAYTANCSEVPPPPPPPVSNVKFISTAGASGTNGVSVTLPSHQTGGTALAYRYGSVGGRNPQTPAGYTSISGPITWGSGGQTTLVSYKVLTPTDTTVAATTGLGLMVAVYRGVSGVGAYTTRAITNTATLTCAALSLTKTDGSSWVLCMGGDSYATSNAKTMAFPTTTNRSAGLTDGHAGLSDTNTGVAAWTGQTWLTNTVLPSSNPGVEWTIELLST